MLDSEFVLAPVRLFTSDSLLSAARPDLLPDNVEITDDLDRAMLLENGQDLPEGYRIWSDVLSSATSAFYSTPEGREGRQMIETEAQRAWEARGEFERALRIKRIRKTITPFEEFWLTVAYDLLELLKSVSLGRYILGGENAPALEAALAVLEAGFYPCGWHGEGRVVALDPRSLAGHRGLFDMSEGKV